MEIPWAQRIDAIVPAYNEEKTIGDIVKILCADPNIDNVWVVCDGCSDNTAASATRNGAQVIALPVNGGKGAAMFAGVNATTAPNILFMDADLVGLTPEHITQLIAPVKCGVPAVVGVFRKGRAATDLAQIVSPHLSGQRIVPRWLMEEIMQNHDPRALKYGIEMVINRLMKWHRVAAVQVPLFNLTQRTKEEKLGMKQGVRDRLRMYRDILAVTMIVIHVRQLFHMIKLR